MAVDRHLPARETSSSVSPFSRREVTTGEERRGEERRGEERRGEERRGEERRGEERRGEERRGEERRGKRGETIYVYCNGSSLQKTNHLNPANLLLLLSCW